jgi:hypothetical protein
MPSGLRGCGSIGRAGLIRLARFSSKKLKGGTEANGGNR